MFTSTAIRENILIDTMRNNNRILIVGLGNLLLRDDGVGVHVVRQLINDPPPGSIVVEVGTAVIDALHLIEEADRILALDAMQAGGKPGSVYAFGTNDVADSGCPASLHELGLVAALRLLPEIVKPEIKVIGVEPEIIDFGLELSPSVEAAVPKVIGMIRDIVAKWQCSEEQATSDKEL